MLGVLNQIKQYRVLSNLLIPTVHKEGVILVICSRHSFHWIFFSHLKEETSVQVLILTCVISKFIRMEHLLVCKTSIISQHLKSVIVKCICIISGKAVGWQQIWNHYPKGKSVHETIMKYPEAWRVQGRTQTTEQGSHYYQTCVSQGKNPVTYPHYLLMVLRAKKPFTQQVSGN